MSDRPDFLVICVDQMQAACMSCADHPDVQTPNLDRLADGGVRFSRAYCDNPVCTPSRLSIMTGLSSRQHGVYCNGQLLSPGIPTVASVLREAGYRTKACGKMHLHPWSLNRTRDRHPQSGWRRVGQDHLYSYEDSTLWDNGEICSIPAGFFGFESVDYIGGHIGYFFGDYINWLQREHPDWGRILRDRSRPNGLQASYFHDENARTPGGIAESWRSEVPVELHHNNWIADCSITYINSLSRNENFFLWCSFPDPHHPFAACKPYSEMYNPATLTLPSHWENAFTQKDLPMSSHGIHLSKFNERGLREMLAQTYGMITQIDGNIGRLMKTLESSGRLDNTVIVFMADHGDYLGSHHLICKGVYPFEELIRVPYIWHSPSNSAKGQAVPVSVSLLDFAPTILDYAGVPMDQLKPRLDYSVSSEIPWFQGISLKDVVDKGAEPEARSLIISKEESIVDGQDGGREVRSRCLLHDQHKLVLYARDRGNCLLDLECDPCEQHNLWDTPDACDLQNNLLRRFALKSIRTEYVGIGRVAGA